MTRGSRQEAAQQDGVEQPSEKSSFPPLSPSQELGRSWIPEVLSRDVGTGTCSGWKKAKEQDLHIQKGLDVIAVQKSVQNPVIILALW